MPELTADAKLNLKNRLVPAIKSCGQSLASFSFETNQTHSSLDAAKTVISNVAQAGISIDDSWDYFLFWSSRDAKDFLNKAIPEIKEDPTLVIIELIDQSFNHVGFWLSTFGLGEVDYYFKAYSSDVSKKISDANGDELANVNKVMMTKTIGKALEAFIKEVIPVEFAAGDISTGEEPKKVGDVVDVKLDATGTKTEPFSGYAIYLMPMVLPQELQSYFGPKPLDPIPLGKDGPDFKIIPGIQGAVQPEANLKEAFQEVQPEINPSLNTEFPRFSRLISMGSRTVTPATLDPLILKELGKFKSSQVTYSDTPSQFKKSDFTILELENGFVAYPTVIKYGFMVYVWPKDFSEYALKVKCDSTDEMKSFLMSVLGPRGSSVLDVEE